LTEEMRNPCVVIPMYAEDPDHYTIETLDIGCGGGTRFQTVERAGVSLDLSKPDRKLENFVRASAEALPFKEGAFKCVTMFDVIEHVENPTRCIREVNRALQENGEFIMGTPNCMYVLSTFMIIRKGMYVLTTPNNTYEVDADHVSTWGPPELHNLMQRGGFRHFKITPMTYRDKPHKFLPRLLLRLPWRGLTARQILVKAWKRNN